MAAQDTEEKSFLEKAAYVVTPGSVIVGLLYYLGNRYRSAYYSYFGISTRDLQLTPQDYLLDSPTALFLPLWIALILGLIGIVLFRWVERWLSHQATFKQRRIGAQAVAGLGAVLLLISFPVLMEPTWWQHGVLRGLPNSWLRELVPPLLVAVGALLLLFALYLRRGPGRRRDRFWSIAEGLLLAAVAMILFFDMSRYAYGAGMSRAQDDAERGYRGSTPVLVHSRTPLHPSTAGPRLVSCQDHGPKFRPYQYSCRGFRILAKSDTRYFLVPQRRPPDGDITYILRDDDNVRVEVLGKARG
ncbi:hypothetical protein [Streptomyces sp. NPDC002851]